MRAVRRCMLPAALAGLAGLAGAAPDGHGAGRQVAPIDWAAARGAEAGRAGAVPAGAQRVRLPVLVLPAGGDWGEPRFHGQDLVYAALYAPAKARLGVFGSASRLAAAPGMKLAHAAPAFESIGDGADYSFTRFGAAYTLRITCDEPLTDRRCTDPAYLTEAAKMLVVAGGAP